MITIYPTVVSQSSEGFVLYDFDVPIGTVLEGTVCLQVVGSNGAKAGLFEVIEVEGTIVSYKGEATWRHVNKMSVEVTEPAAKPAATEGDDESRN